MRDCDAISNDLDHSPVGPLSVSQEVLRVKEHSDRMIVAFTAEEGSPSEPAPRRLASSLHCPDRDLTRALAAAAAAR